VNSGGGGLSILAQAQGAVLFGQMPGLKNSQAGQLADKLRWSTLQVKPPWGSSTSSRRGQDSDDHEFFNGFLLVITLILALVLLHIAVACWLGTSMPMAIEYPRLEIILIQASFGAVCTTAAMALLSGSWQAYVAVLVLVLIPLPVLCFMGALVWSDLDLAVEGRDRAWYENGSPAAATAILLEFPLPAAAAPADGEFKTKQDREQEPLSPVSNQQHDGSSTIAAKQKAASDVPGMDTNHDGVVDQGEFIAGGGTKEEFDRYDANGDGVLDADEPEKGYFGYLAQILQVKGSWGSAQLIEESYKELFEIIAEVKAWIAAAQRDNNCQPLVDTAEFQNLEQICEAELLPSEFNKRARAFRDSLALLLGVAVELAVDQTCIDQLSELLVHAQAHYDAAHAAMSAFLCWCPWFYDFVPTAKWWMLACNGRILVLALAIGLLQEYPIVCAILVLAMDAACFLLHVFVDPFVCRLEWRVAIVIWTLILIRTSLAVSYAFGSDHGDIMNHCTLIVILFTSGCTMAKLAYHIAAKSYHKLASMPALFTDGDPKTETQGSAIAVRVQNSQWLVDMASEHTSISTHKNSQYWSSLAPKSEQKNSRYWASLARKSDSSESVAKDTQEGNPVQNSRYWSTLAPKSDSSGPVAKVKREGNPVYIELNSEGSNSSEVPDNKHAACEPSHKGQSAASKCRTFDPDSASSAKEDLPPKPNELQSECTKDPVPSRSPRRGVSKSNSQKLAQLKDDAKKRDSDWQALNQRHKQERADLKIVDNHPVANKQMQPKYDQSEAPSLALHNQSQAKEYVFRL